MTKSIFSSGAATRASHIVPFRTSGAGSPLFCFPGSGGNADVFQHMAAALPEGQPVYAIDLEWLCEAHEDFTIEQIAAFCLDHIRTIQRCGPYYFCGYSFGGLVAYEMAMRLIGEGDDASLVALLDAPNPAQLSNLSATDSLNFRKTYLIDRFKEYGLQLARGDLKAFTARGLVFVASPDGKVLHACYKGSISADRQTIARHTARQRPRLLESLALLYSKALSEGCRVLSGRRSRSRT